MLTSRRAAYLTIVATALATYAFAAYASLWRAPQGLGVGAPAAYASFQDGSLFGIQLFTAISALWASACVVFVLVNLKWSDAWVRRGRHRFISLAGSMLMTYGLLGTASWMPYWEVGLAMEHVIPWQQQAESTSTLFQFVWVTAACAIVAASMLGAVGAAIDRMIGKAPLLVAP